MGLNLESLSVSEQENAHEIKTSPAHSNLKPGLSSMPMQYSRINLGSRTSIGKNFTVTPEGQKDIQNFSQNPDIDERGKVS